MAVLATPAYKPEMIWDLRFVLPSDFIIEGDYIWTHLYHGTSSNMLLPSHTYMWVILKEFGIIFVKNLQFIPKLLCRQWNCPYVITWCLLRKQTSLGPISYHPSLSDTCGKLINHTARWIIPITIKIYSHRGRVNIMHKEKLFINNDSTLLKYDRSDVERRLKNIVIEDLQ